MSDLLSHVCVNCSVRFFYDPDSMEITCPVCGTRYHYSPNLTDGNKRGEWVEVMQ